MGFKLGKGSLERMAGVHPDLVLLVKKAIQVTSVDFTVTEGLRTMNRQRKLYASGASKTLKSRHLTGHAVDLAPYVAGTVRWDWPLFHPIAKAMKQASKETGIKIEWGGDWKTFKDGPHFQLPWREYPLG